eukprot:8604982-Alexandrium_andersonii.AAC.1
MNPAYAVSIPRFGISRRAPLSALHVGCVVLEGAVLHSADGAACAVSTARFGISWCAPLCAGV